MAGEENKDAAHTPPESENRRMTGAVKLEAHPGEVHHNPSRFYGQSSDEKDSQAHMMQPVYDEETHQSEGVNPPGTFGTDADVPDAAEERDAATQADRANGRAL